MRLYWSKSRRAGAAGFQRTASASSATDFVVPWHTLTYTGTSQQAGDFVFNPASPNVNQRFNGNQVGGTVIPGQENNLWFQFLAPSVMVHEDLESHYMTIGVTVEPDQ